MIDTQNKQQVMAYELIANTNSSFFLTGRAGTGKTTFLQNVQKMVDKQFITLAPTGVAAILAGGYCSRTANQTATTNLLKRKPLRQPKPLKHKLLRQLQPTIRKFTEQSR